MGKKPTTSTEKDRKNYEEGTDVVLEGSTKDDNGPSWDSREHIWDASRARKVADNYEVRNFKTGLRDVMRYIKTAANSGQYECTVYNDNISANISADIDIDGIINALVERGYTVKKFEQYGGWYVKISW